ncbi:exodeoxyribonuclease VII large subunit [Rudanella paleaurantiibacter]|uniref:Exodeoxyribonuclease VII large subunit n=1 Tax=Rudanella paleaurantiibacter TaxID=2614655 RepID=A0A7J5U7T4_9BACT|nr:exodeoxyribonuclease VII large subunit [Rudanella paleaurantiibacter]KAB7733240.1 exodeoxyribonuclease VII large subunit [Rudanella paleaurantiibacter]
MSPIRLADLAYAIEAVVEERFSGRAFWVVAETSDIKNYPDRNYCFLTLVDRDSSSPGGRDTVAKLEAAIWRKNYGIIRAFEQATGVAFARNISLLLQVTVGFHAVYGMRLEIHQIDHSYTLGNLERERQAILDTLVRDHADLVWQEGGAYVTANQLLPRPSVWQRIALIAAPGSDGWRDFRHELTNNLFGYQYQIDEYLTQIQGQGADRAICTQLDRIRESTVAYDAVVIVRGGGSQLDFGSFDTLRVGLAVAGFPVPVLTGIGHERNVSIADMLCHQSVKTPTKAAAFLIDHNRQFEEQCLRLFGRLIEASRQSIQHSRQRLTAETERFRFVTNDFLKQKQLDLVEKSVTLKHLDPSNVLRRGYAIIQRDGRIITKTSALAIGDSVQIQLADGITDATIR